MSLAYLHVLFVVVLVLGIALLLLTPWFLSRKRKKPD